ncbi:MAG: CBS domain-containing protein [Nocardioidaceae bacterium]|nr:CBS domain-containing protein [Marmoricola sp.]
MRIHEVMGAKIAHRDVVSISPEASVAELIDLLNEHNIGAVVVSADGESIAGIVSERDVVRKIKVIDSSLSSPVSEIMTTEVHTCSSDDVLNEIRQLMTQERVRHVPVVDEGHLIGVVSIGDVVKSHISQVEYERDQLDSYVHQT